MERRVRGALLIAPGFDANRSLLVPVGGPEPGAEWAVWDHDKDGSTRWSSFLAYLHDTVEEHLGVDADEGEVSTLIASAEAGDPRATRRLEYRWVVDLLAAYDRLTDDQRRIGVLYALDACGARGEAVQRARELLDGNYRHAARALLHQLRRR